MAFKILGRSGKDLVTAGSTADNLSAEARRITNVAAPVDNTDVATKTYVDTEISAINVSEVLDGTFRIANTVDDTKELAFDVSGVATATTRTVIMPDANVNLGLVATAVQDSLLGAANGVATLNANGKLTAAQIPAIAITETFVAANIAARDALIVGPADGEVQEGDVAIVTDASADPNVDAGGASYIYDGAAWQRLLNPNSPVQSVNGQTDVVVLDSDDVAEGATNFYYTSARFDSSLATKTTADLTEGSNLYFTEARVLATALTGYVVGADAALAATDTVLEAFGKLQAQVDAIDTSGFATAALDNLASTAVNADILPDMASTHDLGSPTLSWDRVYAAEYTGQLVTDSITSDGDTINITADGLNSTINITSVTGLATITGETGVQATATTGDITLSADAGNATLSASSDASVTASNLVSIVSTSGDITVSADTGGNVSISSGINTSIELSSGNITVSAGAGTLTLDGATVDFSANVLANLDDPLAAQDAATKNYVDTEITGAINALPAAGLAFNDGLAGEAFAADQVWLVRRAKDGETAGRYYKAQADGPTNSRVVGFIIVGSTALIAGDAVRVYKLGEGPLGTADTAFPAADINNVIYLSQTVAGKWTLAPSETAGQWLKEVGFVANTTQLEFQPGLLVQA